MTVGQGAFTDLAIIRCICRFFLSAAFRNYEKTKKNISDPLADSDSAVWTDVSSYHGQCSSKIKTVDKKGSYRYYYDKNGKKVKNKVKKIGKHRYSFDEKGRMQTGWQVFGSKKAYFSKKSGKMLTNKTVSGIKIGKSGYVKLTRSELSKRTAMEKANAILKKITNSGMTKREKLYAAYNYMSGGGGFYYCTWRAFQVYDGWEYDYATEIYEKRGGNCYNFACGFAMLAKAIGYDAQVVRGRVPGSRDRAADGMTRHALVKIDGLYYDPEAQFSGWARGICGSAYYPMYLQILSIRTI